MPTNEERKKHNQNSRNRGATGINLQSEERQYEGGPCRFEQRPDGLVSDILSRLSVKTILNCRCVCKAWLFLISKSHFARLFSSISESHCSGSIGFVIEDYKSNKLTFYHIEKDCTTARELQMESMSLLLPDATTFYIQGSLHGFVCLRGSRGKYWDIYMWNPILGEYITIPPSGDATRCPDLIAIGFSGQTNEYKVLKTIKSDDDKHWHEVEIYTVGAQVWRSLGKAPLGMIWSSVNSYLHGAHHYLSNHHHNSIFTIHSFNFEREQFGSLPLPLDIEVDGDEDVPCSLEVLEGCLCLCVLPDCYDDSSIDMWIMKDYGVKKSWTKILVFEKMSPPQKFEGWSDIQPIMFLSDGEILLVYNGMIVARYNPAEKSLMDVKAIPGGLLDAITYTPCFVSLNCISNGEEVKRYFHKAQRYA